MLNIIVSVFCRFFLDGAHTLNSIKICKNWFLSNRIQERKKVLIFNLTGDRDPNLFFTELEPCGFDMVIFTPNIGSLDGQDSIGNYIKIIFEMDRLDLTFYYSLV